MSRQSKRARIQVGNTHRVVNLSETARNYARKFEVIGLLETFAGKKRDEGMREKFEGSHVIMELARREKDGG